MMDDSIVRQRPTVSPCGVKLRLAFSSIGVFVGLSVCIVFIMQYKNINVGLWGLMSGIAAGIALGVTIAYSKRFWDSNPTRLKSFMLLGCFIQLAGVCGVVAYLVLAISQHQALTAYGDGFYLTAVWCAMTWKWGFALLLYSRAFMRSLVDPEAILNQDQLAGKVYGKI